MRVEVWDPDEGRVVECGWGSCGLNGDPGVWGPRAQMGGPGASRRRQDVGIQGPKSAVCAGCGSAISGTRLVPTLGPEALLGGPPQTSLYPLGPALRMLGGAGSGAPCSGCPAPPFHPSCPMLFGVLVATAGPLGAPGWCPLSSTWKSFISVDRIKGAGGKQTTLSPSLQCWALVGKVACERLSLVGESEGGGYPDFLGNRKLLQQHGIHPGSRGLTGEGAPGMPPTSPSQTLFCAEATSGWACPWGSPSLALGVPK